MIILIDNYDSFTFNLRDYLMQVCDEEINVIRNDAIEIKHIKEYKPKAIVISPGPKTPSEAGISKQIVQDLYKNQPILGICLGHQVIGEVFGGKIKKAERPMHGKISTVTHSGSLLFSEIPREFQVTRYHSLIVDRSGFPGELEILAEVKQNGEIMALRHRQYPIYGVQFHPESILTQEGLKIISNFVCLIN